MHGMTIAEAYELVGNYSVVSICNCASLYMDSSSCKIEGRDPVKPAQHNVSGSYWRKWPPSEGSK